MNTLVLEQGVCDGQSVTCTEVQQQHTNWVLIREAIPPDHSPSGVPMIANMSIEVPPSKTMESSGGGALSRIPPRVSKKAQYSELPFAANYSQSPLCNMKLHRGSPLVHRGQLQNFGAQPGTCEYPHTCQAPLTLSNSRKGESPASLSRHLVPQPVLCVEVSPTISSWYLSTSCTSSGYFPAREMTFHIPRVRFYVQETVHIGLRPLSTACSAAHWTLHSLFADDG
ncbi:hypothetical protein LDENG_00229370, partial [Lucifuga dentata]